MDTPVHDRGHIVSGCDNGLGRHDDQHATPLFGDADRRRRSPGGQRQTLCHIRSAALDAGADDLAASAEMLGVDRSLARYRSGDLVAPLTTSPALSYAREQVSAALREASAGAGLALLQWAEATSVPLDDAVFDAFSVATLAPAILRGPISDALVEAVATWPTLRRSVIRALDSIGSTDERQLRSAVDDRLYSALSVEDLTAFPVLHRVVLLRVAETEPDRRVDVLDALLADVERHRGGTTHAIDELVASVWPDGDLPPSDAVRLLDVLTEDQVRSGLLPSWLSRAIDNHAIDDDIRTLARRLARHSVKPDLSLEVQDRVDWVEGVTRLVGEVTDAERGEGSAQLSRLDALMRTAPGALAGTLVEDAAGALERAPYDGLAAMLLSWPSAVVDRFLARAEDRYRSVGPDDVARTFVALVDIEPVDPDVARRFSEALKKALGRWRKSRFEAVEAALPSDRPDVADWFASWRQGRKGPRSWRPFDRRPEGRKP